MQSWQDDLLSILDDEVSESEVFSRIERFAVGLGFEFVAYGFRLFLPAARPTTLMINNYPIPWQQHYAREGYLEIDPTVQHGVRSQRPLVWSDTVFEPARPLWDDAQAAGLRVGWAQSSRDPFGGGMLSLARSGEALTPCELTGKEARMRWLVNVAHMTLSRTLVDEMLVRRRPNLTPREIEVLKWTADGKTADVIADILHVSIDTVNFHIKNAMRKLQVPNKTAAVVRALMFGFMG